MMISDGASTRFAIRSWMSRDIRARAGPASRGAAANAVAVIRKTIERVRTNIVFCVRMVNTTGERLRKGTGCATDECAGTHDPIREWWQHTKRHEGLRWFPEVHNSRGDLRRAAHPRTPSGPIRWPLPEGVRARPSATLRKPQQIRVFSAGPEIGR